MDWRQKISVIFVKKEIHLWVMKSQFYFDTEIKRNQYQEIELK